MTYCICSRSVADYTSTALRIACTNNMHEYHDLLRICATLAGRPFSTDFSHVIFVAS
jgi:hypothetical protein